MKPIRIKTISEFHKLNFLPPPDHSLISVVDYAKVAEAKKQNQLQSMVADYYSVSVKRGLSSKMRYGQQEYDFDEGIMYFLAPDQVLQPGPQLRGKAKPSGWILLIHPDFLWNTPLAKKIRRYGYFDYSVNEALFLSDKEEATINGIVQNIKQEASANIDTFTQNIIISQLETLFNYAERYYQRQFITRKISNHKLLDRLEAFLSNYFADDLTVTKGLPTVQDIADALNTSPGYLSGSLKTITGQNTQQHIHNKVIEIAKQKLSTTDLTVSEIAYELGFEHPQSFNKLFKAKTASTPLAFRQSFN